MKTQQKFWLAALLFLPLSLLAESKTGYVNGDSPSATVSFTSPYATSYSISASPTGSWVFTDDFGVSGYNGWYQSGAHTARCEKIIADDVEIATVWVDAATAFGVTINGKMYIPGGTGGSLVDWSVTGSGSGNVSTSVDPPTGIIAVGSSKGFTYKINGSTDVYGLWWDSSKTPSFTTENYSAIGPTYNFSSNTAGIYTLTAARNGKKAKPASASVKNVEVATVSATYGTTTVTSTTDSPGEDETIYAVKKENSTIIITATPYPAGEWPTGYPTWTLDGTAVGTAGSATYTLGTETAGDYTVIATCGIGTKAIKVVVLEIDSLTRERLDTSRKPSSSSPMPIIYNDITNIITVKTKPVGFEDKVELILSGSGKGEIIRDSQDAAKWIYKSPTESKSDVSVNPLEAITINSKILNVGSSQYVKLSLLSVFHYYGTKNNGRNNAWQYARWKYDISVAALNSVGYDPSQSTAGLTNTYTNNMTLGTSAFAEEWSCASILGHENVHGGQDSLMNSQVKEQEASMWELDHSNAPSCSASPLTYIYNYCKYYYDDTKAYYIKNGGTVTYP